MNYKEDYLLSEYWNRAYQAYSNISFSPERRADSVIKDYSEELEEDLKTLGEGAGKYKEKYINHFTSWLAAKGRCLSAMITGPARFPVARNEKAMNAEHNNYEKFRHWRERYFKAVNRVKTPSPEEDLDNALADLDKLISKQELMKLCNALVRKHYKKGNDAVEQALVENEIPDDYIREAMNDSYSGLGFPGYSLTNNNAKIKARKEKVQKMRARIDSKSTWEDIKFDDGYITIDDDRVKVFHDQKPEREVITALKSKGFRWSRHWSCWSRKHTANAVYDARMICTPEIMEKESEARREKAKLARAKEKDAVGEAMENLGAFFAFGTAQFEEKRQEGVKYASLGMGIVCPVDNVDQLIKDLKLTTKKKVA